MQFIGNVPPGSAPNAVHSSGRPMPIDRRSTAQNNVASDGCRVLVAASLVANQIDPYGMSDDQMLAIHILIVKLGAAQSRIAELQRTTTTTSVNQASEFDGYDINAILDAHSR
jgi:hypothetical protein